MSHFSRQNNRYTGCVIAQFNFRLCPRTNPVVEETGEPGNCGKRGDIDREFRAGEPECTSGRFPLGPGDGDFRFVRQIAPRDLPEFGTVAVTDGQQSAGAVFDAKRQKSLWSRERLISIPRARIYVVL
jgi:hypothetical protein